MDVQARAPAGEDCPIPRVVPGRPRASHARSATPFRPVRAPPFCAGGHLPQIISRTALDDAARMLGDADEKYWQLHTSSRAEVSRLEAQLQGKIDAHSSEAVQLQLDEDERMRHLKAEHDKEVTEVHQKFADVMGKAEEEHKQQ
eukprot:5137664-Prymnesium_polylepis.1